MAGRGSRPESVGERSFREDPTVAALSLLVNVRRSGEVHGMLGRMNVPTRRYVFVHTEPFTSEVPLPLRAASGLVVYSNVYLHELRSGLL